MSLRRRMDRLERLLGSLSSASEYCPSCGAPSPCVPSVVVLDEAGVYEPEGALEPCSLCAASGTVTPISPGTGHPTRPVKLILMGVRLEDWLVRHAEDDLPAPLECWFELAVADQLGRG